MAIHFVHAGLWSGQKSFLSLMVDSPPDSAVQDRMQEFVRSNVIPEEAASRFGASGYVADTVHLALNFVQYLTAEPLSAVLARAITAGGDTDTIASITGQIAGTVVGATSISRDFFDAIDAGEEIVRIGGQFARFVASVRG